MTENPDPLKTVGHLGITLILALYSLPSEPEKKGQMCFFPGEVAVVELVDSFLPF